MPWHALPHPLKLTKCICSFYRCLITCKNSSSYLNVFVRYCDLKNTTFWLMKRFLDHNYSIRFFSGMWFLQEVRRPLVLSYVNKKVQMNGSDFCHPLQTSPIPLNFGSFLSLLDPSRYFAKNQGSSIFKLYDF